MAPKPIIYINSWPGVGKHTIAQALATRLGPKTRVAHNHLHIDLTEAVLPRLSAPDDYQSARKLHREATFRILAECEESWDSLYIFTDFQTSNALGRAVAQEYRNAAVARGCVFIAVVLECDVEENMLRMGSEERGREIMKGKGMLLDTELLAEMRGRGGIYRFGGEEKEVVVDVSLLGAEEAAERIVVLVRKVMGI